MVALHLRYCTIGCLILAMGGCRPEGGDDAEAESATDAAVADALAAITAPNLESAIRVLAADSLEGRLPSTPGEEKTLRFLRAEFERLGLEPGNGDSWFQEVPLVSIAADPEMELRIEGGGKTTVFEFGHQFVAVSPNPVEVATLDASEIVFVGYGIVAPEYGWNDYAAVDPRGKTVVILVNDPGYRTGDAQLFTGTAMTYYGRWTYKYEEAARQGASGAIVVHETGAAGYPWEVVQNGWSGPQFALAREGEGTPRLEVEGWVSLDAARDLFRQAVLEFDTLAAKAQRPGFEAVPLGLTASVQLRNDVAYSNSKNLLALLPGADLANEVIVYTAHWDHLGRDTTLSGDQVYNGARDNAAGTAALLEIARAFKALEVPPRRSVLFLAVTAEEQGLLGSKHYATHPVYPLAQTVAALNIDAPNTWGETRNITIVGYGNSELDDYLRSAAAARGRVVTPDPEPEKGLFYRSDHFSFAKQGVPALYAKPGTEHPEYGEEWGMARLQEYTAERYHKPGDELDPSWDLSGLVKDLRLLFLVGYRLSTEPVFPNWVEGNEFRARRDSMLR